MVTEAKTAASLHVPNQFFLVCKCQVKPSTSSCWLFGNVFGINHQRTLDTSWIACALLCCHSSRY